MLPALVSALFLAVLPVAAAPAGTDPGDAQPKGPPPAAAAWLARVSPATPGAFPPPRSFDASYRLTWSDVQAAHADIRCVSSEADNTIRTTVKTTTVGAVRLLYKLDGTGVAVADRGSLRPLRLDQTEDRNGKHVVSHVVFTPEGAVRTSADPSKSAATPLHGESEKAPHTRRIDYPGIMDIHAVLLHIRSLPLAAGDERTFIVMSATTPYLATIKVLDRERVKVNAGEFPAIVCSVSLQKINKRGELEPYKSLKEARAWIGDDANRVVLKVETQIFIGAVEMELEKISFPAAPAR